MSELDLNQIEELASNLRAVSDQTYSAAVAVADVYNATSSYDIGDYCIKSTLLYKCNTAIPSGEAWDSGHWDEICVSDELNEIRSNVIHVGTSAPSNPNVQLWLDTDEPGVSVVSSVNGAIGTVVLDADDVGAMSEWDLLWTNASPTSDFAAQTIQLDLSNYDMVGIEIKDYGSGYVADVYQYRVGASAKIHMVISHMFERAVTVSSTGVAFGGCVYAESYPQAPFKSNDGYVIPTMIWGVKGVQTS